MKYIENNIFQILIKHEKELLIFQLQRKQYLPNINKTRKWLLFFQLLKRKQ